ncbi:non-ribosomal peptide synthetase [Andreprevotia chitinilytica]|uniref:non-ribosomal peptide synthetase n=1 Tax=Andreprevotia chitinilytica TaxID=396808 RepID=UPI0005522CE6|nr:non-ribosomal peptide synthetase [Andreprevotia chitinilytica]
MDIKAFLMELRELGVTFSVQNGKLRSQSAKGVLPLETQTKIRDNKDAIIAFLTSTFGLDAERAPLVRVSRDTPLPLSYAQQRLWFLDQLEAGSPFYNIPNAMRFCGALDVAALRQTLNEIVRRHETLRTHFALVNDVPQQIIAATLTIELPVADLTEVPAHERESVAQRRGDDEAKIPFDLATGPVIRAKLLKLAPDDHILLYTLHHIVSDGWSMGVLIREMAALYGAYTKQQPSPLPELAIQYADFAHWQRQWLTGATLDKQADYWKKQLAGAPALLALPTDQPRPLVQTYAGATHNFTIAEATTTTLYALSRTTQSTLFMVLSAAFNVLLQRYSGQNDICIGTPIANRNRDEVEPLIGFFVNSLVLRTDLEGNPTFTELLQQVRQTTLAAYNHQDMPFDQVVEILKPERSTSHAPLFQVMLVLQNAPLDELNLPGLTLKPATATTATAKLDLRIAIFEHAGMLTCSVEYKTDLFDAATIERLGRHFTCLLDAVATNPEQRITQLPLQTPAERAATLAIWDQLQPGFSTSTDSDLLLPLAANNVLDLFERAVNADAASVALLHEDREITYGVLDILSTQIARGLTRQGSVQGQTVGILLDDPILHIVAMLGVLKAGGVFAALSPAYPTQRLNDMIDVVAPTWLISQAEHAALIDALYPNTPKPGLLQLDEYGEVVGGVAATQTPPIRVAPDAPCYVYFTSGSTGKPKAVLGRVQGLAHFIQWEIAEFGITADTRISQLTIPTFDVYLRDVFAALCAGGTVCIPPADAVLDAPTLLGWLEQTGVNLMHCVPTLFRTLLDTGLTAARLPDLQHVLLAGEMLLPADANRWIATFGARARLVNLYGPTETTLAKFFHRLPAEPIAEAFIPVGRPIPGAQAILLDDNLEPCFAGQIGEIHIRTPYRSLGYFGNDAANQAAFIANPLTAGATDVLYKTGDLGCILPNGEFRLLGRKDFQVKIRGMRIELGEIEAALAALFEVRAAVVAAVSDGAGQKRLVAYVVPKIGGVSAASLHALLAERLPDYMVPAHILLLDQLPLTVNGKIDRKALPTPDLQRTSFGHVPPRTPTEQAVAGVWAEVLRLERVGAEDDFFASGGHSLLATQVISKLRATFNIDIALRALFEASTVAALARKIDDAIQAQRTALLPPITAMDRRDDAENAFPLSFSQQRLWFLDQFERSAVYNIPFAIRLQGALDTAALTAALNAVVARHEALRTTFGMRDGEPVQIVAPQLTLSLDITDLGAVNEADRADACAALLKANSRTAFDLTTGPLLKAILVRLAPTHHVLSVTLHHIVTDGWATGILVAELAALYEAHLHGTPSPLAPLPLQYADFACWQRRWLSGAVLDAQLGYWQQRLQGAPALLALPTDRPRPTVQTYTGGVFNFTVPADIASGLHALSQQHRATLFMTLLAAFGVLLSRYSGQTDLCIGTPIANRNRAEIEPLIGIFINTLVLRARLDGNPAFAELLQQVRETTLGAYDHQDTPFEQLVEVLRPERQTSHSPLFQVMLVLQNNPRSQLALSGLTLETVNVERATSKYDLTLNVMEDGAELQALFEYNTDLFDAVTIARMAGHFTTLLEQIVAAPEQRVADLGLLSAAESRQLLVDWNDTAVTYPTEQAIHQLFEQHATQTPNQIALVFECTQLSYGELDARANQLAHYLRSQGVGPDTLVGLCLERSLDLVIGLLAVLKAGGAYLPLDPDYPAERLAYMLADAQPQLVLTQSRHRSVLAGQTVDLCCLDELTALFDAYSTQRPVLSVLPQQLAYVIYTSGSTGRPKGTLLSHAGLTNLALAQIAAFGVQPSQRVLQFASFNFDAATSEIFMALGAGATLCLAAKAELVPGAALQMTLQQLGIQVATLPPVALPWLDSSTLPALITLIVAGEACPAALVDAWAPGRRFFNAYGPTETTVCATIQRCDEGNGTTPPIGHPIANTRVYLLDDALQPVPVGVAGELYVAGVGLARGYLGRPDLTAKRFMPNPYGEAGERMYRSGDLARYLPDGRIEYLGRIDQQVKLRGFRIELGEIEASLTALPAVRDAVVLAREDEPGDKRLVAYLVTNEGHTLEPSSLREHLLQRLPDYMIPAHFIVLDQLPLTPNGKVDRKALPAPDRSRDEAGYVAPRNATEAQLAAIWAEVLKLDRVGVHDNFFELGGHSLLATQLVSKVRQHFGIELALRTLFAEPTVAALSKHLAGQRIAEVPAILPVDRSQPLPLSFAQQRLWFLDQFETGSAVYNMPMALKMTGTLDIAALRHTLNDVVARHEALRTTFITHGNEPTQHIHAKLEIALPVTDLSDLPHGERDAKLGWLAQDEARTPFDLGTGPLIRAGLIRLDETTHVLLLTLHHIVTDGWSMGILMNEITALYRAHLTRQPAQLPTLPIQYADFAAWQRQWLSGPVLQTQLDYWQAALDGVPTQLTLPFDRPRPPVQTFDGTKFPQWIPAATLSGLQALGRRQDATLFMTLTAAFSLLLSRYSGQTDLCIGTPIANRNRTEIEPLIGFFVNTLVLRTRLDGNPAFDALLQQVRDTTLGAYEHQDLPFEQLVDVLKPERDTSHTPLFQVMIAMQNNPRGDLALPGLMLEPVMLERDVAKFDLTLGLIEHEDRLLALFEYNTDLFDETTVARMAGHFLHLLEAIVADSATPIADLPMLGAAERRQLLVDWNDTTRPYPADQTLHQLFEAQVQRSPDHPALAFEGVVLSYAQLNQRANRLAHYLRGRGVGPEQRVALCVERSLDMVVGMLGILKAGSAYVPLDPAYPHERLAYMLADAQPALLLTQQSVQAMQGWADDAVFLLDTQAHVLREQAAHDPAPLAYPDNIAYVIYTSGSTGRPKGVQTPHRAVVNIALAHIEGIHRRHAAEKLHTSFNAPYVFDASVSEFILLLDGHTLHIVPEETRLSPEALGAFFTEHQLDALDTTPAQLRYMLEHGQADTLPRIVVFGGEAIDTALWQSLQAIQGKHFFNAYGPTECTVDVAIAALDGAPDRPVIGKPEANTQLYVLDAGLNPVPVGVAGELYIAGDGLARGYLNRPDLTAASFIPNPYGEPGTRMYKSGDSVRYLPDGNLEYLGRIDDQVKIRGFRIEVGEIETAVLAHREITEAVVTPVSQGDGKALAAYLVRATSPLPPHVSGREHIAVRLHAAAAPFSAAWRLTVGEQSVGVACLEHELTIKDADARSYRVYPLATLPYGRAAFDALHVGAWPDYFAGSPTLKTHWESMYADFPEAQIMIKETFDAAVGIGNAVLLNWDGTRSHLPRGWDGALTQASDEHRRGVAPNTLVVLAGVIDPAYKNRKIAGLIVDAFKLLAKSRSLSHVLVALRPIAKTQHQEVSIADYSDLRDADGKLVDGWLRLHCDAGGRVVGWEEHSQYVTGSPEEWASWSGQRFARSGLHQLPDTLAPVHVSLESGVAHYYDPCIWVEHPLPAGNAIAPLPSLADVHTAYRQYDDARLDRLLVLDNSVLAEGLHAENAGRVLATLDRYAGKLVGATEMREHLARTLPPYMVPSHFVFLDRMPLTTTGKLDRKALPAPDLAQATLDDYVAPASKAERALCDIWQGVLGVPRVGVTDNFFEIGGDSILSIRVISRAKQAGIVFTAKQMFAHQTIRTLLPHAKTASGVLAPQGPVEGTLPLLPIHLDFFAEGSSTPQHFNQSAVLCVPADFNADMLQAIVTALYARHDALRLRFSEHDGVWQGHFQPFQPDMVTQSIGHADLRGLAEAERLAALAAHGREIQSGLSLADGPLLRAVWFQADGNDNRLLLVLHHLIVDGVSWRILRKDIEQGYRQLQQGAAAIQLEGKGSSYAQWGEFLRRHAQGKPLQRERSHWLETLHKPVDALPAGQPVSTDNMGATMSRVIGLDAEQTQALLTRCHQAYGTQINDLLLAGLMLGLSAWAGVKQLRITLEGHGREELSEEIDLNETIGWFTSAYPVWLQIANEGDIGAVISGVKEQLRTVPSKGIGFGILRHLATDQPLGDVEADAAIVFNYLGQYSGATPDTDAPFRQVAEFAGETINPQHPRSHLLGLNGGVRDGCLSMALDYHGQRYSQAEMDALGHAIETSLQAIIAHCLAQQSTGLAVSDFSFRELVAGPAPVMPNAYDFLKRFDLNHWNASDLLEVTGGFSAEVVQRALQYTLALHDAMRAVFVEERVEEGGRWRQQFQLPSEMAPWWETVDLSALPLDEAKARLEAICAERQQSLDIRRVLFKAIYFTLGHGQHPRLMLVIHHAIVDRFGSEIFIEDLEQACVSLAAGQEPALTPKTASMKAVAETWQARAQHPDVIADLAYWRAQRWDRFKPLPAERHPDKLLQNPAVAELDAAGDELSIEETAALEALVAQFPGLSLGDVVTCAVVFAYGNWTGSRAIMLLGGQNGRNVDFDDSLDLSRTVGWCMHYTRTPLDLCDCATTLDALYATQRQLAAVKGREANYTLLRHMCDDPLVREEMAGFNDAQLEFGFVPAHVTTTQDIKIGSFSVAPESRGPNEGPMRPGFRPFGGSAVHEGRLGVGWTYCRSMYTPETMQRFVTEVTSCLRAISRDLHAAAPDQTSGVQTQAEPSIG